MAQSNRFAVALHWQLKIAKLGSLKMFTVDFFKRLTAHIVTLVAGHQKEVAELRAKNAELAEALAVALNAPRASEEAIEEAETAASAAIAARDAALAKAEQLQGLLDAEALEDAGLEEVGKALAEAVGFSGVS
jgi:hypothetical protein